jgi:hypothetical protein
MVPACQHVRSESANSMASAGHDPITTVERVESTANHSFVTVYVLYCTIVVLYRMVFLEIIFIAVEQWSTLDVMTRCDNEAIFAQGSAVVQVCPA